MIRTVTKNAGCALARVLSHIVISAMSSGAEVILNLISAVLRHHMMILLTLIALHNMTILRVNYNIIILITQKKVILYNKIDLS